MEIEAKRILEDLHSFEEKVRRMSSKMSMLRANIVNLKKTLGMKDRTIERLEQENVALRSTLFSKELKPFSAAQDLTDEEKARIIRDAVVSITGYSFESMCKKGSREGRKVLAAARNIIAAEIYFRVRKSVSFAAREAKYANHSSVYFSIDRYSAFTTYPEMYNEESNIIRALNDYFERVFNPKSEEVPEVRASDVSAADQG